MGSQYSGYRNRKSAAVNETDFFRLRVGQFHHALKTHHQPFYGTAEWRKKVRLEFEVSGQEEPTINLSYDNPYGERIDASISLLQTTLNYGGTRWWFECPQCNRRVGVLYFQKEVGCNRCMAVIYEVQYAAKYNRVLMRIGKIRRKLGSSRSSIDEPIPPRPKGLHKRTYVRQVIAIHALLSSLRSLQ